MEQTKIIEHGGPGEGPEGGEGFFTIVDTGREILDWGISTRCMHSFR